MASPRNFTTIPERELEDPDIFLPTSMRYEGEEVIWTKPGYATYQGTPINHEMADSTILCNPNSTVLPPNMARISKSTNATQHQKKYIDDYKFAAATIDHWKSTKHPAEDTLAEAIRIWKITCDKLTTNPFFSENWFLPAFFPIYSYQCAAGIQNFYANTPYLHPSRSTSFWEKQKRKPTKCSPPGKPYITVSHQKNLSLSPSVCGFTSTTTSTNANDGTPGRISSRTPPSANGEKSTKQMMANQEQQQELELSPNSQYYDGDTQPFSPPPFIPVPPPTVAPDPPPKPAATI
eukprot:CAMPEP_0172434446 /NCGR_PEP_ID=MMETSP1064-20121228/70638_1 /TAXON_ID=202472 /ORGANISM="Aulacoseira subarctica , Strain CCAP 1002/5" /LENGTH=291 /DNA_ID=CAMNT_0013182667 /DNA_START=38 /DNA_END=912 /DNA_ORIENTATION=+